MKLKWKHKNDSDQYHSQCGRYWFCHHQLWDYTHNKYYTVGPIKVWHDDTHTIVGYHGTVAEAKAAAQSHLDSLRGATK